MIGILDEYEHERLLIALEDEVFGRLVMFSDVERARSIIEKLRSDTVQELDDIDVRTLVGTQPGIQFSEVAIAAISKISDHYRSARP